MSAASSGLVRLVRDHATVTGGQFVNLRSHWDECRQGRVVVVELFWPGTSGYDSHVTAADLPVQPEACTGVSASWCPVHGDCTCERTRPDGDFDHGQDDPLCPLHSYSSTHADLPVPALPEETPQ